MRFTTLILAVAVLTLAACQQSVGPAGVDQPGDPATPTFSFGNGPPNPGESGIFRFTGEGGIGFFTFNKDFTLFAIIFADDRESLCVGPTEATGWEIQRHLSPGAVEDLLKIEEAFVTIRDISGGGAFPFCASPIVGNGRGDLISQDNNLFLDGSPRTNSFGFNSQGTLALTAGGCANYNIHLRFAIQPGDAFVPRSGDIRLHDVGHSKC